MPLFYAYAFTVLYLELRLIVTPEATMDRYVALSSWLVLNRKPCPCSLLHYTLIVHY